MATTVAIVGAGRVGRTLARKLRGLGWSIGVVVSRSRTSAIAAVRAIGAGTARGEITRSILAADMVLITTPDDAVGKLAVALAKIGGEEWRGKIVLHTSGALDRSELAPLARFGASTGSLHPLQTFSGRTTPRLEGVVFALEGDRQALRAARQITLALGGIPIVIQGGHKPAYHAAAAFAAGSLLAVLEASTQILMAIGFTRRSATRAVVPLVRQMIENFERMGPRSSWTGPLSRGDYATVRKHLVALKRFPKEMLEAYLGYSRLAVRLFAGNPEATLLKLKNISQSQGRRHR
jgi:predicted short-subunit dehydrogenase-like oxidoreductase (DUF2520 family)